MARKGPVTTDTSTIALGLAQIRVVSSSDNIGYTYAVGATGNSIGALANTKFTGNTDWYKLESGFPLIEDYTTPIREGAMLECAPLEITPKILDLAHGNDITSGSYSAHSGEVALGGRTAPDYVRMEAYYVFPNGTNTMTIIFPRAQVSANVELDLASEDAASIPITFESKNASSDVSGGNAVWDSKPLGAIIFA